MNLHGSHQIWQKNEKASWYADAVPMQFVKSHTHSEIKSDGNQVQTKERIKQAKIKLSKVDHRPIVQRNF